LKIVLRIGGSVLGSPPDATIVEAYVAAVRKVLERGHKIAVVVGGGRIAREYIETARTLGLPRRDQDTIAIHVSRLNAKLVGIKLGAPSVPVSVSGMVSRLARARVAVMGGLRPGITTDTVATLVAEAWRSDLMIKASNQDGIYTADPRLHKGAKLLRAISYAQLVEILGGEHSPGIHSIVDPVAVRRIAEHRIKLVVINGGKPESVLMAIDGEDVGTRVT
jgi:uridylate kinase